ncbi:alpha/beta hydrolase [Brevibacterium rongguiense]|nr:alpha/beta hydrolase [Brevibacterium rongguiense]
MVAQKAPGGAGVCAAVPEARAGVHRALNPVRLNGPMTPHADTPPPGAEGWQPDILGAGFEQRRLALPGGARATLVRAVPGAGGSPASPAAGAQAPAAGCAVLHLHGWSDYFYHAHLADFWTARGAAFYALDLRDYGRNLDPTDRSQRPGYIANLADYDEEIAAALAIIRSEHRDADTAGPGPRLVLSGHSTGGLTAALWAHRHPGATAALVLNAPWLEFQYTSAARKLLGPLLGTRRPAAGRAWSGSTAAGRTAARGPLPVRMPNYYTLAASQNHGAPPYDLALKPPQSFPVHAAWLRAVFAGHRQVERGLDIDAPVLVQTSARSLRRLRYDAAMGSADIILDVEAIARRAVSLGPLVTIERIPGAVHDVFLSAPAAVERAFAGLDRFARGYLAPASGA